MRMLEKFLAGTVERGVLDLTYSDGRRARFGQPADGYPEIAIRFTDERVPRQILLDPRLGAGEAYIEGRLVVEKGDVMQLVSLLRSNRPWEGGGALREPTALKRLLQRLVSGIDQVNQARRAKTNVAHHYDIGNDFYRLFLDSNHMQYSCAYWADGVETLEQAQEAKLAHIAAKLALADGQKVLDIGCGWGGMAIYLARHFDVEVLGITLSEEQLALARERAREAGVEDRTRFELLDYRALPERGETFDRIVSVGMFEHVGRPQFRDFFRACGRLLPLEGTMLLHTIGRMGRPGSTDAFTRKYVFPGGYIPALSETVAASEPFRLIAADVETLRLHYARTLREWYARTLANREAIVDMHDEKLFRLWCFYLAGATAAFEYGSMCNYQIQYARDRHGLPLTRDYIGELSARLRNTPA